MKVLLSFAVLLILLSAVVSVQSDDGSTYHIGTGIYDITGPAVEVEMMGYAMPGQINNGIHFRQRSRAYIIADSKNKTRVVFVNIDACMATQAMKMEVVRKLKAKYNGLYTDDNVCISGIHTHSGPAGYFQYVLYEVMSKGFIKSALDVLVDGIVESISRAHDNMKEGKLYVNSGDLLDASFNRSPTAYLLNPERGNYKHDTDKEMTVLKMVDKEGKDVGMISWFAVHCTSMNRTNGLISGDNKGYASYLMEQDKNPGSLPGQGKFIAAFGQSNEGDVSPNILGPRCSDTGDQCDAISSTCNGQNEKCYSPGPGKDMFDSTRIIGERQYMKAKELYKDAKTAISGDIQFRHSFVDFSNITVTINGSKKHTCSPAMGDSFAAGTIDGTGAFNFRQNDTTGNKFWEFVCHILHNPTKEQKECHHPKPILLDTGSIDIPYPWQPKIIPIQLLRVGQLVIIAVPGEFTTMSGRFLRDAVQKKLTDNGFTKDAVVVIAGLANTYSDYITTYHEYQQQRYEAASTIFGPYTLDAHIQEYSKLAEAMAKNKSVPAGPYPPNYLDRQISFELGILKDAAPRGKKFGDVNVDVDTKRTYTVNDTVKVEFWAGNPRSDLMTEKTFLTVEKKSSSGHWEVLFNDGSWETKFHWKYSHSEIICIIEEIIGGCTSIATIEWTIPSTVSDGTYRIQHFGNYHNGGTNSYNGTSSEFQVKI